MLSGHQTNADKLLLLLLISVVVFCVSLFLFVLNGGSVTSPPASSERPITAPVSSEERTVYTPTVKMKDVATLKRSQWLYTSTSSNSAQGDTPGIRESLSYKGYRIEFDQSVYERGGGINRSFRDEDFFAFSIGENNIVYVEKLFDLCSDIETPVLPRYDGKSCSDVIFVSDDKYEYSYSAFVDGAVPRRAVTVRLIVPTPSNKTFSGKGEYDESIVLEMIEIVRSVLY